MNPSKRPGGPLRQKSVSTEGVEYDPFHPPKLFQKPDGTQKLRGGKKLDKDEVYAARFWEEKPEELREVMIDNICQAAEKEGFIGSFVDPSGITEKDKEKLSAYRQLARELGYEVGEFKFYPKAHTARAPIYKPREGK